MTSIEIETIIKHKLLIRIEFVKKYLFNTNTIVKQHNLLLLFNLNKDLDDKKYLKVANNVFDLIYEHNIVLDINDKYPSFNLMQLIFAYENSHKWLEPLNNNHPELKHVSIQ